MKLVVLLFLGVMHLFESLNPLELAIQEIDFLDLYYNQEHKSNEPESMDIVFINSGSISDSTLLDFRSNFTNILNAIDKQSPSVVGIDIEFELKTNSYTDSNLTTALNSFPHLVMGAYGKKNAVYSEKAVQADISLIGDLTATKKYYQLKTGDTLSFALALAQEFLKKELDVESDPILIDYRYDYSNTVDWEKIDSDNSSNSIATIEGNDILKNLEDSVYLGRLNFFLKDKIVLIGHLGKDSVANPFDSEDKHIVPGGHQNLIGKVPTTPGIFIHTQALEMLINDRIIQEFKGVWRILVEWVLLFMIAILYVYLAHASMWFKPIVLPLSFVFIFLLVYVALLLRDSSIYWAVGALNLQIVILIEAVEFYEPISIWLNKKWHIKSYFSHEKDH